MLVYLWFRFELIYGVAAVVAVFHDTLITVGAFSLTNQEITLTVIAAILTLIGYSMNDTIVVFDRIRENLRLSRRETLTTVVNRSINQTLSRTVLTSGLTFLTVLSLYLFGGEVLHGFSFALVVGILIGTYSSIAVAAPMLVAYQEWRAKQRQERHPARRQTLQSLIETTLLARTESAVTVQSHPQEPATDYPGRKSWEGPGLVVAMRRIHPSGFFHSLHSFHCMPIPLGIKITMLRCLNRYKFEYPR